MLVLTREANESAADVSQWKPQMKWISNPIQMIVNDFSRAYAFINR